MIMEIAFPPSTECRIHIFDANTVQEVTRWALLCMKPKRIVTRSSHKRMSSIRLKAWYTPKREFVDTEIWSLVSWIKILLKPHYNNIKQHAQKSCEVSRTSSLGFRTILLWESGFSVRISIFEHAISAENEFRSPRLSGFFWSRIIGLLTWDFHGLTILWSNL